MKKRIENEFLIEVEHAASLFLNAESRCYSDEIDGKDRYTSCWEKFEYRATSVKKSSKPSKIGWESSERRSALIASGGEICSLSSASWMRNVACPNRPIVGCPPI